MKALSVRQPWAWLIVNGFKNIENRSWGTNFRGPVLIHASRGMTRSEWFEATSFMHSFAFGAELIKKLPDPDSLRRGGIVGETNILNCVSSHPSNWFCGPYGFILAYSRPLPFQACRGMLGFFDVSAVGEQDISHPELF